MVAEFGRKLLGKPSHEATIKLLDYELKTLETCKKLFAARIKLDQQYSNDLTKLASQYSKLEQPEYNSGILQAVEEIINGYGAQAEAIKQSIELVNKKTIDKINTLIHSKCSIKKYYIDSRNKIDNSFKETIQAMLNKKHDQYKKLDVETNQAKKAFDKEQTKKDGGNTKKLQATADKYRKTTMKFHLSHNNYLMHLIHSRQYQDFYRNQLLPDFLTGMEDLQVEYIRTFKSALNDYVSSTSPLRPTMQQWQERCEHKLDRVDALDEYKDFVAKKGSELESAARLDFEAVQFEGSTLPADDIVLNMLTFQCVETDKTNYEEDLVTLSKRIDEEDHKLNELCNDIELIKRDAGKFSLMPKQLAFAQCELNKQELVRTRLIYNELCAHLNRHISKLGRGIPPPGLVLPTIDSDYCGGGGETSPTAHQPPKIVNKIFKNITKRFTHTNDEPKMFDHEKGIQDQLWFHSYLTRDGAEMKLVNEGDFLLRESSNLRGEMVLSVRGGASSDMSCSHFKLNSSSATGEYMFEGRTYESITKLIEHHYHSRKSITSKKEICLLQPIVRDQWQLAHSDVVLHEELGRGNFGTVNRGYLKSRELYVAVKTCRESSDQQQRENFLAEAKLLQGYDHGNIVRLIGICTDQEPIYIVMELVPGGDLRKYLEKDRERKRLTDDNLRGFCTDACKGLGYLESKNLIHRDVAARNCLVDDKNQVVKITDFGMSRQEEEGIYNVHGRARNVPMKWTAPEAMENGTFTHKSDVWSFGVLTWEIYSLGMQPYSTMTNHQSRDYVSRGGRLSKPHRCSEAFYNQVMVPCWDAQPENRPRFHEIAVILKALP